MSDLYYDDVPVVISVLGGFIILFGLVSFFVKERLYLSEALVSVIVGIILGPVALKVIDPSKWGPKDNITYEFTRIVISIQVMCSGVALPRAYLVKEWKSLIILLIPVKIFMWVVGGLIIRLIISKINLLEALTIAACITPTDPILANSVVKGRFAEKHVPPHMRNLLSAESAANDALTYIFLFLSIYLMEEPTVGKALETWILTSLLHQVALSFVLGIIIGYIARKLLYLAESNRLIDKESFLVFAIALALFLTGIMTFIGGNEFLACFVAGTSFSWDDWFRKETEEAHLQEVIDMLLNLAIFVYVGAVIPWSGFGYAETWRLVVCAALILIFRRVPAVLALKKFIPAMKTYREAIFIGWFGPIGIGAIHYLTVVKQSSDDLLHTIVEPVVYFAVLSSILVHGITIPLVKISKRINTRTLTGGSMNNQVSRLQIIRIGTDIKFRKEKTSAIADTQNSDNMSSTTVTIESLKSMPELIINEPDTITDSPKREGEPPYNLNVDAPNVDDIPQNLTIEQLENNRLSCLSLNSNYTIWDEGDSFIIENNDGEDVHVLHNLSPQERSYLRTSFESLPQQEQRRRKRSGGFFTT